MGDKRLRGVVEPSRYSFYEYCYDYFNYKAEVEMFDDDMVNFCRKSSSSQFYFNPMVYKIAEAEFLRSSGEKRTNKFVEKFLSNDRWGIDS